MAKSDAAKRRGRKQARARQLAAEGMSVRGIAARLGVGASTVSRWLRQPKPEGGPPPPEPGNQRATKHGAHSEARIAERAAVHVAALLDRYPNANPESLRLQASRLARIDAANEWLAERGSVVKGGTDGDAIDLADRVGKWSTAAERWFERMDAQTPAPARNHRSDHDWDLGALSLDELEELRALAAKYATTRADGERALDLSALSDDELDRLEELRDKARGAGREEATDPVLAERRRRLAAGGTLVELPAPERPALPPAPSDRFPGGAP